MLDAIGQIIGFAALGDQFEVLHAAANRDAKLMRVDHAGEKFTALLPRGGLGEKIFITRKEHPLELSGAIQQGGIRQPLRAIGLRGENIHPAHQKCVGDDRRDMHIHVKREAHNFPDARNRRRTGESADVAANFSARRRLSSI